MAILFLIRHGESEWNRVGRIQGQINSPLTNLGIDQAKAISKYLSKNFYNKKFVIYSSPLGRALRTAEIIAKGINYQKEKIIIEERLKDFNLGEITGISWEKVAENLPELARLRLEDPMNFYPIGGESGSEFEARLRSFLSELVDDDTPNILVSHGIVNKFIRGILKNLNGKEIIALGESQDVIYHMDHGNEMEINITQ